MMGMPIDRRIRLVLLATCLTLLTTAVSRGQREPLFEKKLDVTPKPIASDKSVKWDYDIVYVRAKRAGDKVHKRFYTDFSQPVTMQPGADLMLLHPDGSEELLVEGGKGGITDPIISFDGKWCYYTKIHNLEKANQWNPPREGADIYKIHLKTRKIVRLTNQQFTPNTGAADTWSKNYRHDPQNKYKKTYYDYGVFNMGPHPLPNGKIVFTSNRDGFKPSRGYPSIALQMFVMDDSDENVKLDDPYPNNIEKIGHLNIAGALHPVVLRDGRIMFSTLESQGIRSRISWGVWTIHPDGTNWEPMVSAFDPGGASNGFHFQTQLSDGSIVIEGYYNQNNSGFGTYIKLPDPSAPKFDISSAVSGTITGAGVKYSAKPSVKPDSDARIPFGPAYMGDPRNKPWRMGRHYNAKGRYYRMPFMPTGSEMLTPFAHIHDGPADPSDHTDKKSPAVGKFTHPSGAPDNHLLTIWSPGPTNHQYTYLPQLDGGIYLIKDGKPIDEPGKMLLIKNDPNYNESWPRAVVPYERIYGVKEPVALEPLKNDGKLSKHLPKGTPFGLIGSSSFYKRESYPNGVVPKGSVTATYAGKGNGKHRGGNAYVDPWKALDAFTSHGYGMPLNWHNQGGDAGLYENSDIHAVRILAMEPTTDRDRGPESGSKFFSHANERLRILGEIPLRKFGWNGQGESQIRNQPIDPDGNPDTSFLAKIPADTVFTFQTIDKHGMVLNMSQTWHQLRPGEVRTNCGGCHAHSQEPTLFKDTAAASEHYKLWDLTKLTPMVTSKVKDESKQQWDVEDDAGLRTERRAVAHVEYYRDIQPILQKSCVACHTKSWDKPAGNLILDADGQMEKVPHNADLPGTYYRLATDEKARFGHKPPTYDTWGYPNASRYIRKLQSRRSLLTWKIYGKRLDGFHNDDHPSEPKPGAGYVVHKGEKYTKRRSYFDIDFVGSQMPPPEAVAGKYQGPDGKFIKVESLTDEDRRTITRWIDLGCPIDLDYNKDKPNERGKGWMLDDNRPVLTVNTPAAGQNVILRSIRIGMDDYYSGLDLESLHVEASFNAGGIRPGHNLAPKFKKVADGVWEFEFLSPIKRLDHGRLVVSIKDKEGNETKIVRQFSVGKKKIARADQ